MDNYRRRLLVYFNAQTPSVIIDPTIQDVPNGVYIEDTDGLLYPRQLWPSSGVTPNSVVVIANLCKVRLALTLASEYMKISSGYSTALDSCMTEFSSSTTAKTDYNGRLNTDAILSLKPDTDLAAGYCNSFIFPDGVTKGHLPSCGEWLTLFNKKQDVIQCLQTCNGEALPLGTYWSSTYYGIYNNYDWTQNARNCWEYSWTHGDAYVQIITSTDYVRPVAEYKPIAKDLSMVSGTRNTANCYMVHNAGTYRIPLVYGNAIKNGQDNQVAYKPGTVANGLANFINHAGTAISAPWITKSGTGVNGGMGITVDSAQLIWQDVDGLTTNYNIEGDYLTFEVPSFVEGNAVIAVKSGSTIVWSWHIWVTSEDYSNLTVISTGSHNYSVTPCNLGWVPTSENKKQGYSPYYQWGRKDAFPPSNGSNNTDKKVYVGTGVNSKGWEYQTAASAITIGTNIQNPWIHYNNNDTKGPVSTTYYNMWDAKNATTGNITTATKKTIYDPCPPGFCVPTGNLWYYFGNGDSRTNSTWDSTNKGTTWNTGITGDALWLPAAGFRSDSRGTLYYVGSYCDYWSVSPSSNNYGHNLYCSLSTWSWDNSKRAYGYPIRPVAEE